MTVIRMLYVVVVKELYDPFYLMISANIVAFWKEHVYFSNAVKKIILKRLKEF